MTTYLLIYALLLVMSFYSKANKYTLLLVMIAFSLLIGFRGLSVGADTREYYDMYSRIGLSGYYRQTEILYGYANYFAFQMRMPFQWFQSLLTFFALFTHKTITRYSPHYGFSAFLLFSLYFVFYAMNIYREMLACFIGVSAIPLLEKSKKDKIFLYYCLVALASGFHNSALILVLFPLAKKLNISRSLSYSLIILTLIMGIVLPYNFLGGYLGVYDRLVETDVNTRSENEVILAVFLAIYWIGEFFLIDKMSTITFKSRIYYKILFLGVLANNLLIKQALGLRVILYFNILKLLRYHY